MIWGRPALPDPKQDPDPDPNPDPTVKEISAQTPDSDPTPDHVSDPATPVSASTEFHICR
jgi:hypothetical protein